jgi:hypothetical protein
MICELASISVCSLFRRAEIEVRIIGARGIGLRGTLPDLAANAPLSPMPRAIGSPALRGWMLL